MRKLGWLGIAFVLAACGGKIDGSDGGTGDPDAAIGPDASTTKDAMVKDATPTIDAIAPPPACSPVQSSSAGGPNGACQISQSWSCGATKYSIQCSCPDATCTCSEESGSTGTGTFVQAPNVCPACDGAGLAALCNFPTN